jgi:tetratricopeptide (TPR) repeat protein
VLNDALHDLHHRAGWPSLRTLARDSGVSHTTVSKTFSSPSLPSWGTLEVVVDAMAGDTSAFHDLWLAASTPADARSWGAPRIAGRLTELTAVRRHLETGTGLLLVTGEAGIGKTTLVTAAARSTDIFVATGHCLPLSTEVPLMPVVDVLRTLLDPEDGRWLKEAIADCPPYVRGALGLLLPELEADVGPQTDEFARQRLFTAVSTVLGVAAELRPFAILVEDLHWADPSTFDVLDHLLAHTPRLRLVVTWRNADPNTPTTAAAWLSRLDRLSGARSLDLMPLDRAATREQLHLALGRSPEEAFVDEIHARTRGHPLFTEQLATAAPGAAPRGLDVLFDGRLADLDEDAWSVVRALGVADRALLPETLGDASGLDDADLVIVLRDLAGRRLLSGGDSDTAGLRHPLIGEAVRRRLVPGEAAPQHRRLAEALGARVDAEPAEVARHWKAARDNAQELPWRVAAAERARARSASREALDHLTRVVELWPDRSEKVDVTLTEVLRGAFDAAGELGDFDSALALSRIGEGLAATREERAILLEGRGDALFVGGDTVRGLECLDQALALHAELPPSSEMLHCLVERLTALGHLGRHSEARSDVARALSLAEGVGDLRELRRVLTWASWFAMTEGDLDRARTLSDRALALSEDAGDPFTEVYLAVNAGDVLLQSCASVEEIDSALAGALALIRRWGLGGWAAALVQYTVALAHLRSGDMDGAAEVVRPTTAEGPELAAYELHCLRVLLDASEGRLDDAIQRADAIDRLNRPPDGNWAESQLPLAEAEYWSGLPARAATRLDATLAFLLPTDNAVMAAPALARSAGIHAELAIGGTGAHRRDVAAGLRERRAGASLDPLGPAAVGVAAATWRLVWEAELARLEDTETLAQWARAASGWDRLTRPHEAAYCRWRAAQVALREGQGTVAARLLKQAAAEARAHVPLSGVIAKTAAGAR